MKAKLVPYVVRLRSSRGSDHCICMLFECGTSTKDVKAAIELWSNAYLRNSAIDYCAISFKRVRQQPRKELLKRYKEICKRKAKIHEEWSALAARLNPQPNRYWL